MSEPVILASDHQQPSASVQLLPFGIAYDGPANVSDYFTPTAEGGGGVERQLPDGYTGLVLKPCGPTATAAADTAQRSWQAARSFERLTLWNHDLTPTAADWHNRCIDWLTLADQIHAPVLLEQVEKELMAIQQQQQQQDSLMN